MVTMGTLIMVAVDPRDAPGHCHDLHGDVQNPRHPGGYRGPRGSLLSPVMLIIIINNNNDYGGGEEGSWPLTLSPLLLIIINNNSYCGGQDSHPQHPQIPGIP